MSLQIFTPVEFHYNANPTKPQPVMGEIVATRPIVGDPININGHVVDRLYAVKEHGGKIVIHFDCELTDKVKPLSVWRKFDKLLGRTDMWYGVFWGVLAAVLLPKIVERLF